MYDYNGNAMEYNHPVGLQINPGKSNGEFL